MEISNDAMNVSVSCCTGCRFVKEYDYGRKIYYCNHEERTDDMGKLGADHLPKTCPEWCPERKGK